MEIAAAPPPHVPVLIGPLIAACSPVQGTWLDGTFGAGGYTSRLLDAGADVMARDNGGNTAQWPSMNRVLRYGRKLHFPTLTQLRLI